MNIVLFALIDAWLAQEADHARWDRNYAKALGRGFAADEVAEYRARVNAIGFWRGLWVADVGSAP